MIYILKWIKNKKVVMKSEHNVLNFTREKNIDFLNIN